MKKVLIADDEPNLRALVAATLAVGNYEIIEAVDGDDAWAALQRDRPEVALLDIQMPGRTGLDLVQSIRARPELADMRVILLTAKTRRSDISAGLVAGADTFLPKPFSPTELLHLVEQALAS